MRYDINYLNSYVEENNITLFEEYKYVNRETKICGKCIHCGNRFEKSFRAVIRSGALCRLCAKKNGFFKRNKTCIEKYGYENPFQCEKVKKQIRKTMLRKFDVEFPSQSKKIRKKMVATLKKNYDVEVPAKSKKIRNRMQNTCIRKYGYKNPFQCEKVKKQIKNTIMKKYKVDHHMKNTEIFKKQQQSAFKYKTYILPSGNSIKYQGYENHALDYLLKYYDEDEIVTNINEVPIIFYEYENTKHRYYTDIYIKLENKCIEIKSIFTFEKEKDKNLAKIKATKEQGYDCEIWIIDKKGNFVDII